MTHDLTQNLTQDNQQNVDSGRDQFFMSDLHLNFRLRENKNTNLPSTVYATFVWNGIRHRVNTGYQFDVADRIYALMQEHGFNQKTFAQAIGHRPSEIHRWLSGEHNFTLKTIALLTDFFDKPIINVVK